MSLQLELKPETNKLNSTAKVQQPARLQASDIVNCEEKTYL